MRIDERLTRTKASRYVWGGLTLVCALGLVYALRAEQTALQDEIDAANARTARYASTVVYETVTAPSVSSTEMEFRFRDMLVAAQGEVFTDPTVARMRLWDVDGVLRFSTDQPRAEIGALQVQDQRVTDAATEGRSTFTQTTEPFTQATTGRDGEPTRLLQTFVPLTVPDRIEPLGAVQVDYLYDSFVEASREPWLQVQVVTAGLLGLFALLFLLSLRRPIVGTAEPMPALPAPAATDETDDTHEKVLVAATAGGVDPAAAKLRQELEVAQEQLKQAEEAYHYLETRLKKTQEDAATPDAEPPPEIQEQVATAERDRAMAESRAELAEQRLAEMQRRLERLSSERSASTAGAASERPADAAPAANGAGSARAASPAPPTSEREPAPVAEPAAPSEEPSPAGVQREADDATPDPASELRARLARTAARKKLGPNVGE